ncbi:MAG TPA: GNAT family N-acetyltransferase [Bryobacteraceae bacterium]|nr:GNAT family N-acetyltransferase [Bryobacteraceae bacterium]HPT26319.1 GNAT family N-acetyltransferase [Bryobacteraceae bacterium]
MDPTITYRTGYTISVEQYRGLLNSSTLGERRPVNEPDKIASMLRHANLLVTAWDGPILVGASRCFSDFANVTYCADLCVHLDYQHRGIGKQLLRETLASGGCRIVLLSAPKAVDYYPKIGMERHPSAWITTDKGIL